MTREAKTIRALTAAGCSQKEIAARLGRSRSWIHKLQRRLRITHDRHGPRPRVVITPALEREILSLLKAGRGGSRIGKDLKIGEHQVRLIVAKHRFRRRQGELGWKGEIDPATRAKLVDEIENHRNFAAHLADKYSVPYKAVLKLAHETLQCPRFRSGRATPLISDFPQREKKSSLHRSNIPH